MPSRTESRKEIKLPSAMRIRIRTCS
jgi:hypothetical protein